MIFLFFKDYDSQSERPEINDYLTLEDYMGDEEREQIVSNAATQTTQDNRNRKIKPIKHPGLVLKTPIAYQPHTDLNFIPIRKDGIGKCNYCKKSKYVFKQKRSFNLQFSVKITIIKKEIEDLYIKLFAT